MIKKNNCFITPGNRGNDAHTETTKKADKKKAMYIISSQDKTTAKTRKNAIKKHYFFISL